MIFLHLDSDFKPLSGTEIAFERFTFSGGEPHIKINPHFDRTQAVTVTHRLNSFNDMGLLCLAVDALQRLQVTLAELVIPYFPAARQDRLMVAGEPLSVKVYADLINHFGFQKISVLDPHSEVTPALLRHCNAVPNHRFIQKVLQSVGNDICLIAPDGGALKKIYTLSAYLGGVEVVACSKNRDVKSGKITGFSVYADDLQHQNCLIVDDICDGGATFIGLAAELKNKNAGNLYLAVTHGIFSKGFDELQAHFTRIFTTNSIKSLKHHCLTQFDLNEEILS